MKARRTLSQGIILSLIVHFAAAAQAGSPGDEFWDKQFQGPPGLDGTVYSLEYVGDTLFVGGQFSSVGGGDVLATNIAAWDGSQWSAVGSGLNGPVLALAEHGGLLYAGGLFTDAAKAITNIAVWNGNTWSRVGNGVGGSVYAIAASGDSLYVGGHFTNAGNIQANHIARWDGVNWSSLGSGVQGNGSLYSSHVESIAVCGTDVYVGGTFTNAGGISASNIAKWDGSHWAALGTGTDARVCSVLAAASNSVYIAGEFLWAGSKPVHLIARWNGTNWFDLNFGSYGAPSADVLAFAGNALYVGAPGVPGCIQKWENNRWSSLGYGKSNGVDNLVMCLKARGSTLVAGGIFQNAGGLPAKAIAQWDGSKWQSIGPGLNRGANGPIYASATDGTKVYLGGAFTRIGGVAATNIAMWDGTHFFPLGEGVNAQGPVRAIAVSDNDVYVGGQFTNAGTSAAKYVARWDGTNWFPLGDGILGSYPKVYAIAVWSNNIYVAGEFTNASGRLAKNIARWDGTNWSALGLGLSAGAYVMTVWGNYLVVGGDFSVAGSVSAPCLAKWDGATWTPVFAHQELKFDNRPASLWPDGDKLYVGGFFYGGFGFCYASNFTALTYVSSGTPGGVRAIVRHGDDIFCAGGFRLTDTWRCQNIGKWDGTNWISLGSGANSDIHCLLSHPTGLIAGGAFLQAGAKGSYYLARWDDQTKPGLPALSTCVSEDGTVVSWPQWATDYVLEQSEALTPADWTTVPTAGRNITTNDSARMSNFYRLRKD